jgi:threonyl-tRNA synthetase
MKQETIGKLEMLKCKKHRYADCGKKKKRTISIRRPRTRRKRKCTVTIEEFAAIVDEEIKKLKVFTV